MRKVTTTIALLALVGTSVAIAQRARSSMNPDKQLHDAPVADQVRSEKTLMDPNEPFQARARSRAPSFGSSADSHEYVSPCCPGQAAVAWRAGGTRLLGATSFYTGLAL